MNKLKLIFMQTVMISAAILFGMGLQFMLKFIAAPEDSIKIIWPWYMPLAIILTAFLCSIPTLLLADIDNISSKDMQCRIILHFFCILAMVSAAGFLLKWYENINEYFIILLMFILIYAFVWAISFWIGKTEEHKINKAIKEIQDEE